MDKRRGKLVTVFGGSGFIGTQLVQELARRGWRVKVAVRRPDLAGHVRMFGFPGQIHPVQANLRYPESVTAAVEGADLVINLVGILFERGRQRFEAVQVEGAGAVAEAARRAGARGLVHMSAIGADPRSESAYGRAKGKGEERVLAAYPEAVIVRPSIVFGPGDGFFNLFGSIARSAPFLPLIEGETRFQPVYVGDLAQAVALAAEGAVEGGRVYELGGPDIETMRQLMERVRAETRRNKPIVAMPTGLARLQASVLQFLPRPLLTPDQVTQLGHDNVVSQKAIAENRTFAAFGIAPTGMDAILPTYLWRFRRNGEFDRRAA